MQRDILHFAGNKLQGGWSAADFTKFLTKENLQALLPRFDRLEPLVRVRLLLSILPLDSESKSEMSTEIQGLLAVAKDDKDEWVNITARAVTDLSGPLDLDAVLQGSAIVRKTMADLEQLAEAGDSVGFRPLEETYLNPSLVRAAGGESEVAADHSHFTPRDGGSSALPELSRRATASAAAAVAASQRGSDGPASPSRAAVTAVRQADAGGASRPDSGATHQHTGLSGGPPMRPAAGVDEMFRSSRPTVLAGSRQATATVTAGSERRGAAGQRIIKLLDVDEVKKLSRQPTARSPDWLPPAANGHAGPGEDEEAEEGEIPEAGELLADEASHDSRWKRQRL